MTSAPLQGVLQNAAAARDIPLGTCALWREPTVTEKILTWIVAPIAAWGFIILFGWLLWSACP